MSVATRQLTKVRGRGKPTSVNEAKDERGQESVEAQQLADRLREAQTSLGLRAEDIAEQTGGVVPASTWVSWTRRRGPAAPTVFKLAAACKVLGTTIDALLGTERPREEATICDMATAQAILATTDPDEIERLMPRPNDVDIFWHVPRGARYVSTNEALPLDRQLREHVRKHAPKLWKKLGVHYGNIQRMFPRTTVG